MEDTEDVLQEPYDEYVVDFLSELGERAIEGAAVRTAYCEALEVLAAFEQDPGRYDDLDEAALRQTVNDLENVTTHLDAVGDDAGLILDAAFEAYIRYRMVLDVGELPDTLVVDWSATVARIQTDYRQFDLDDFTYWVHS